jgi:CBS domain containing-hemolysin-like protein
MESPTIPDLGFRLLVVLGLVLVNGFFVAAEFALVTVRKTRVDQLIAEGSRTALVVRRALADPGHYIAAVQLGITMVGLVLGWLGEPMVAATIEPVFSSLPWKLGAASAHSISVVLAFAIITALVVVIGELAPKSIALEHAEASALWVARPISVFMTVFRPFIRLLNRMGRAVVRMLGLRPPSGHSLVHSEEELKMLVTASQEAGVLEEDEEQMLHRVFDFANWTAGEMMEPRTEMPALPVTAGLDQVIQVVSGRRRTSVPVYRNGVDDVIGILQVTDLVRALASGPASFSLTGLIREHLTVPETMKADALLRAMRRQRTQQAVVIDEYGGTAGLVTVDGLMSRIVGELWTDSHRPLPRLTPNADGSTDVDGLTLVADVNERFGLQIDEDEYTTIGGYMLGRLGRRAGLGESVELGGRTLTVAALDGLRVARVRLSRERQDAREPDGRR